MPLVDEDLVSRTLSAPYGDREAFDELVRRHQGHIRANCRFIVEDPEVAKDLAQDVFVKAYFALKTFQGRSSFKTWIRRIKVNHCLAWRRRNRARADLDLEDFLVEREPALRVEAKAEEALERDDLRRQVAETLEALPDTLRIPLVLRDMDGFSYQEIADALGVGLSATKMRIARGREAFREVWTRGRVSAA